MTSSLTSSTARPLAVQMRRDLVARRQRWQSREYWTVKDPLTLKYYRFEEEEFAILSMLDGQTSSDAIRERFEREFAPQRLNAPQLQRLNYRRVPICYRDQNFCSNNRQADAGLEHPCPTSECHPCSNSPDKNRPWPMRSVEKFSLRLTGSRAVLR